MVASSNISIQSWKSSNVKPSDPSSSRIFLAIRIKLALSKPRTPNENMLRFTELRLTICLCFLSSCLEVQRKAKVNKLYIVALFKYCRSWTTLHFFGRLLPLYRQLFVSIQLANYKCHRLWWFVKFNLQSLNYRKDLICTALRFNYGFCQIFQAWWHSLVY